MTTFCTKLIIDSGHHYGINGKSDLDNTFWKKKKQEITCNLKLSPVFRHVPDCANRLYNVGKLKVPHKCLYKVIKKKKTLPVVMVPRLDKC